MAMAGFVCSLSVVLVTVLLILTITVPSLRITDDVIGLLLVTGAILWVAGLILSLRARKRAVRHHGLAKAGTLVSVITAILFLAGLVIWFVFLIEWLFTDLFVVGTAVWGGAGTALVAHNAGG